MALVVSIVVTTHVLRSQLVSFRCDSTSCTSITEDMVSVKNADVEVFLPEIAHTYLGSQPGDGCKLRVSWPRSRQCAACNGNALFM